MEEKNKSSSQNKKDQDSDLLSLYLDKKIILKTNSPDQFLLFP